MRKALSTGGALLVVAVVGATSAFVVRSAFSADTAAPLPPAASTNPEATDVPSPTATAEDIMSIPGFAPLQPGTYYLDADNDPSTSLRVVYEVAADGWLQWIGATKEVDDSANGHIGVTITTVTNLVSHGCRDHSPLDPPVGASVDDLATALADLAPFQVTSPPTDVTMAGYRGKHLELTVPDLPISDGRSFDERQYTQCIDGELHSYIGTNLGGTAFFGYTGPGYTEEFWILDVDGTRLMITAGSSPTAPAKDMAEMDAILDSIRIEP